MKSCSRTKYLVIAALLAIIIAGGGVRWLRQEDEYLRVNSPDGKYTAIVTCRRYASLLPIFPGGSGDKSGFIRIEGPGGSNYGTSRGEMGVWALARTGEGNLQTRVPEDLV
jgi:hypothetical protein